jgi:uncharacterized membrane protein YcaP (DUF421 family)
MPVGALLMSRSYAAVVQQDEPMWNDLIQLGVSAPEKILRTIVVYLVLAVLLRLAGKRDLAALNSFDLVVMLLLSNVVQNAIIGPDNSLLGGILGAVVLVGTPTVLARNGHWVPAALRREGLRQSDVDAALRRQNANGVQEVQTVTLEPGGAVVATLFPDEQSATRGDLAALVARVARVDEERIARIEAKLDELLARQS